ncbi:MAG: hypothetical protein Q4G44_02620 [Alcaligenaceae bacterium]|nr:hypothetical protein [Alcaligenaceae bacterium]
MKNFTLSLLFLGLVGGFQAAAAQPVDTYSSEDPLVELVAQYTPEQLNQRIAKAKPADIRDLLLLLPDSDFLFYFNFDATQRKQLLAGETVSYVTISEIDVAHGYLQSGYEGIWEMIAKAEGDAWQIALHERNCGQYCYTVMQKSYRYQDGKLFAQHAATIAGFQDYWPELFIDFEQLTQEQKDTARQIWEDHGIEGVLYNLPRDGQSPIVVYLDEARYTDAGIPESALMEVTENQE